VLTAVEASATMKYWIVVSKGAENNKKGVPPYHRTSVGGGVTVDDSSPDVKELACASLAVGTAGVALLSACINIVSVEESKAHVAGSIVGSIEGTENKLIAFGISGIDQGGR
jgi:hypothetical protein